jgi:hypothetical protein
MPDQGFETIFNFLDGLHDQVKRAAVVGLKNGAAAMESTAQATGAYNDQSTATRASTVAYVATTEDDGSNEATRAYNEATSRLADYTGHSGQPFIDDAGIPLGADEIKVILTSMDDYVQWLERNPNHAFLLDTLTQHADQLTVEAARSIAAIVFKS